MSGEHARGALALMQTDHVTYAFSPSFSGLFDPTGLGNGVANSIINSGIPKRTNHDRLRRTQKYYTPWFVLSSIPRLSGLIRRIRSAAAAT